MIELSTIANLKNNNKVKFSFFTLLGLVVGLALSSTIKSCNKSENNNTFIDQKVIAEDVVRLQTEKISSLEDQLKEKQSNYEKILKDLDSLKAELDAFQIVKTNTPGTIVNGKKSDVVIIQDGDKSPTDTKDDNGYLTSTQTLFLIEPFDKKNVKIGEVSFSGWSDKPWSYTLFPKSYTLTTVLGEKEDGTKVSYNTFTVEIEGKKYNLPVSGVIQQEKTKDKFYFWNPKLLLGVSAGISNTKDLALSTNLSMSTMSYGNKINPTFLIGGLGIGYSKTPELVISPISYNLGKINNFTHNTYVGPQFHTNFSGYSIQLGIKVSF